MCWSKFERREELREEERTPQELGEPWTPTPEAEEEYETPKVEERETELVRS
jgi:hypothetical protein